jgi:signal transduction histidine kinase
VKQHGGYVWVTSEPGRGTVVRLYLPAVRSGHAASLPDQTEPA